MCVCIYIQSVYIFACIQLQCYDIFRPIKEVYITATFTITIRRILLQIALLLLPWTSKPQYCMSHIYWQKLAYYKDIIVFEEKVICTAWEYFKLALCEVMESLPRQIKRNSNTVSMKMTVLSCWKHVEMAFHIQKCKDNSTAV